MNLREEFVQKALKEGANITQLCYEFQISRTVGYKWINRYKKNEKLRDRSKKPHNSPQKTLSIIEEKIIEVREKNPTWGGRKIKHYLENKEIKGIPAASVISKILKRKGYITIHPHKSVTAYKRFEHDSPNSLWQMDYKGHFAMSNKQRCHPLTILDDHSRYIVCLQSCGNETAETVKQALTVAFSNYGLPDCINCDNGSPWGSPAPEFRYTSLHIWLMRYGVKLTHSRPFHPQTNGKDERFHRTLKYDVIARNDIRDLQHAQQLFDAWLNVYNFERPHEALAMKAPITRYRNSLRKFPSKIPDIVYPNDYIIRNVDPGGRITYRGYKLRVGDAFMGLPTGIQIIDESTIGIHFNDMHLAEIDLSLLDKKSCHNVWKIDDLCGDQA